MRKTVAYLLILMALTFSIFLLINQSKAQIEPTVFLTPSKIIATQLNQTFTVNITISNVQNLWAWDASISWNPEYLTMTSTPTEGVFLRQAGSTLFIPIPPRNGSVPDISDTLMSTSGASGSGVLAMLQFQVIGRCAGTLIQLLDITLLAPNPPGSPVGTPNPTITPTSDSCTAAVTLVINGEPVANAGQDQVVHQGTLVIFNASNSVSSGSNPIYTWSFIDGTPKILEGMIANYTFNRPGKYTVTLTLQDSLGTDNSTVIITVLSNTKPIAKITLQGITAEQSASVEQSITFSGSESYEPGNGTICSYLWNMGDGIGIGTGQTITYAYALPGTYNVTLTVFDANDNNATTSTIINVVQSSSPSPSYSQQSFSLPPAILAILLLVTITVLVGAIFWLRKRT